MGAIFQFRFEFHYDVGPLWADNEAAQSHFGSWIDPSQIPLSSATRAECDRLDRWFYQSMNQEYPPDPSPWRQAECDRFNEAAANLFRAITRDLGPAYSVRNCQELLREDPDLDEYLRAPASFKRKS